MRQGVWTAIVPAQAVAREGDDILTHMRRNVRSQAAV